MYEEKNWQSNLVPIVQKIPKLSNYLYQERRHTNKKLEKKIDLKFLNQKHKELKNLQYHIFKNS